jgi:transcriptional regulator with XRE-family HTH domain
MKPVRLTTLKGQRTAAGLTITELARKANVSDRLIFDLERLHPSIDGLTSGGCSEHEAQRIADALGVSTATIGRVAL